MRCGRCRSRQGIRLLLVLALTLRLALEIGDYQGTNEQIRLAADDPWVDPQVSFYIDRSGVQSSSLSLPRVVGYWPEEDGDPLRFSATLEDRNTSTLNSNTPTRNVERLGVGNVWNESRYESKRYYWNDPYWSRQDSIEFYPTCNNLHELDLSVGDAVDFLQSDGAFRLSALYQSPQLQIHQKHQQHHLRMIHYALRWTRAHLIMAMNDATAMQRVQGSPWIVTIYNACGLSLMSEFMEGGTLPAKLLVPLRSNGRQLKYFPMERLDYAIQTAMAVADVHAANIAHMDIQPKNFMLDDKGQIHLNDFNLARLLPKDAVSTVSSPPSLTVNPQLRDRTTFMTRNWKQDMFLLGKLLYTIRTGRLLHKYLHSIWKPTVTQQLFSNATDTVEIQIRGFNFSSLHEGKTSHRAELALSTLEWCMSACLQPIRSTDRPSALQLLAALEHAKEALLHVPAGGRNISLSLQDLKQIVDAHLHTSVQGD